MSKVWFGSNPPRQSQSWTLFDETASFLELEMAIASAAEVWIDDPFTFPWDSLARPIEAPTTVVLDSNELVKVAALAPWLQTLGPGDRIVASDPDLERHWATLFHTDDTKDDPSPIHIRSTTKRISSSRIEIERRLEREADERGDRDRLVILSLSRDEIVASDHPDFASTIYELTSALGSGQVTEVWGVRSEAGAPLAGAVIGFSLDDPHRDVQQ